MTSTPLDAARLLFRRHHGTGGLSQPDSVRLLY